MQSADAVIDFAVPSRRGVRIDVRPVAALIGLLFACLTLAPALAQSVDWSGGWESRWRQGGAALFLEQDGEVVSGAFPVLEGSLTGVVRGRLLVGTWQDGSGKGDFIFAMSPDGQSFMGRFGTGDWWTGARMAPDAGSQVLADGSTPRSALRTLLVAGNAVRGGEAHRMRPALDVLDFSDLEGTAQDEPAERLRLGAMLFGILDGLTFRTRSVPNPEPGATEMTAELSQAGSRESVRLTFRYRVLDNGTAGWRIVVPSAQAMQATLRRLSDARGGADGRGDGLQSPRGAMRTFLESYVAWEEGAAPERLFSVMNLSDIALTVRADEAAVRAQYLKGVIDRIGFVIWQEIPDDPARSEPYTHFVHPAGTVTIAAFETEDEDTEWQFTPETIASIRNLYVALEDMPPAAGVAAQIPSTFLQVRGYVRSIDGRLLRPVLGVEVWQWLVLTAVLLVGGLAAWLAVFVLVRLILRWRREPGDVMSIKARFIRPAVVVLTATAFFATLRVLGLPPEIDVPLRVVAGVLVAVAGGWLAYNVVDFIGAATAKPTGVRAQNEMLRSIVVALTKIGVIIASALILAEVLAIPYQGVVAGLGIGGLAVAFAARQTLENLIGGLTMVADKPVDVGDFCRFGDKIGTVEAMGLRSIKIRSLERTLFIVPNGEFVNLQLENFAKRDTILLKTVLQLRYETSPDQLRWVLAEVRKLLLAHPKITAEPSRARFIGFGAHSLDVEIFAYVSTSDYNDYLAIQEDIYLRLSDIVARSGSSFAFPSTVNYVARDGGLDDEGRERSEEAVARWRETDRLPFPDFENEERWQIYNSLDYPGHGSPHSAKARQRAAD